MNGILQENLPDCKNITSNNIRTFPEDFYVLSKMEWNVQWSFDHLWSCSEHFWRLPRISKDFPVLNMFKPCYTLFQTQTPNSNRQSNQQKSTMNTGTPKWRTTQVIFTEETVENAQIFDIVIDDINFVKLWDKDAY